MASKSRRLATNTAGEFYVDETCIDCDTCRWMAPGVFDRAEGQSRVHAQPAGGESLLAAQKALLACPTASIGTETKQDLQQAKAAFPDAVAEASDWGVGHCGYHAESSFGAATTGWKSSAVCRSCS
jgi:ferredoxin